MQEEMAATLTVKLGERSYPIHFGEDLLPELMSQVNGLRSQGRKVAILCDVNVRQSLSHFFATLARDIPVHVVGAGEDSKSLLVYGGVLDFMALEGLDRSSALIAIGGGVIGDLGGFAAASYQRGIDFIQVPTTLLAMVDSSVGGKTGINLKAGKNLVGAFHQPKAVYISTNVLGTLPLREFAAGMAEVIKYGLLADVGLFQALETKALTVKSPELAHVISRCCELKAAVVETDERELAKEGGRALLNLGHTFGHAVEQVAGYGSYLHGEAVAVGLCAAARLSRDLGYISEEEVARIDRCIQAHDLPAKLRSPLPFEKLQIAMNRDKKVRAGKLRFVVIRQLGQAATQGDIPPALAEKAFRSVGAA